MYRYVYLYLYIYVCIYIFNIKKERNRNVYVKKIYVLLINNGGSNIYGMVFKGVLILIVLGNFDIFRY